MRRRENLISTYGFDGDELDLAARQMGEADPERGFELLAFLDDGHLQALAKRLDDAGAQLSAEQIQAARAAALRIEAKVTRSATK